MCVGKSLLIFYFALFGVFAQDCGTQGEKCGGTKQCCGGCCVNSYCTEATIKDCIESEDLCQEVYCPPGYDCQLYQPPDCPGCETQRNCVISPER
ncbi:hypothetical protein Trydic_g4063 [Trypoxylus dichotomus]